MIIRKPRTKFKRECSKCGAMFTPKGRRCKICVKCHSEYVGRRKRQRKNKLELVITQRCAQCNKKFIGRVNRVYCSKECCKKFQKLREKNEIKKD